ncbi:hypothetical protein CEY12_10365 [Chryseobacterium sp. T16E-39]|nr:hypothetical protein CEY12_10365 [Chryseobacterium sp. T16E-39]
MSIFIFSQNKSGIYSYKTPYYFESINLLKDGTFKYYRKTEFLKDEIFGNWQLRNDSILVLDSNPQRSKLMVKEHIKKGKKITFTVRDSEEYLINYQLHIITNKKDTLAYRNQFEKSVIKEKPISFYIISTEGLHSPVYKIKGTNSNFFDVKFERQRVFENEQWRFVGNSIIPLGLDGKYSNYRLIRE